MKKNDIKLRRRYHKSIPEINPKDVAEFGSKDWPAGRVFMTDDGRFFEVLVSLCDGRVVHCGMAEIVFQMSEKDWQKTVNREMRESKKDLK